MTRAIFMARLKKGLRGLPLDAVAAIEDDYDSYFAEGLHVGRSEEALCEALGDPRRLAAELRLAMHLEHWRERPTLVLAVKTGLGLLGVVLLDLALLLPAALVLLVSAAGFLAGLCATLLGLWLVVAGLFDGLHAILSGLGYAAAGVAVMALSSLVLGWLIDGLALLSKLHRRVLPPHLPTGKSP